MHSLLLAASPPSPLRASQIRALAVHEAGGPAAFAAAAAPPPLEARAGVRVEARVAEAGLQELLGLVVALRNGGGAGAGAGGAGGAGAAGGAGGVGGVGGGPAGGLPLAMKRLKHALQARRGRGVCV